MNTVTARTFDSLLSEFLPMHDQAELEKADAQRAEYFADQPEVDGSDGPLDPNQTPMPPPGRPHPEPNEPTDQDQTSYVGPSLSMPTLPILHSISDATLINKYRQERPANPISFDRKTREIGQRLLQAKIRRGGSNRLSQGDYTVELASREDATQADEWEHNKRKEKRGASEEAILSSAADLQRDDKLLHRKADPALVAQCRQEHYANPLAFDNKTRKVERDGWSGDFSDGDYSVVLSGRRDAALIDTQEHLDDPLSDPQRTCTEEGIEVPTQAAPSNPADAKIDAAQMLLSRRFSPGPNKEDALDLSRVRPPGDFYLHKDKHVSKYSTSGTLSQHSTRNVEEYASGQLMTFETTIKIKQGVFVPRCQCADVTWDDVLEAEKEGSLWKAEGAEAPFQEATSANSTKSVTTLIEAVQNLSGLHGEGDAEEVDKDNARVQHGYGIASGAGRSRIHMERREMLTSEEQRKEHAK